MNIPPGMLLPVRSA